MSQGAIFAIFQCDVPLDAFDSTERKIVVLALLVMFKKGAVVELFLQDGVGVDEATGG